MAERFTMSEIARVAEEIERSGQAFYLRFAELAEDERLRALCQELAAAEEGHRMVFASIFARETAEGSASFPGDAEALVRTIAQESVFTFMEDAAIADLASAGTEAFLDFASDKERAAIDLFRALRPHLSRRASSLVDEIIEQEFGHLRMLQELRAG